MKMTDNDSNEHDDLLLNILKECKVLPVFLDHIFGFLARRTDFYHVTQDPNSPVGLPEGLAEHLVRHAYLTWMPKTENEDVILQDSEVPEAVFEEEVVTTEDIIEDVVSGVDSMNLDDNVNNQLLNASEYCKLNYSEFSKSESYNGAAYDNYCWSQTIGDLAIIVRVPENVTSKDLRVSISTQKISVKAFDEVLLEGELCQKCKHNDAIWSLDKTKLQINLDKCKEMWWDCLVTSEIRLDLSKLDCSRPFEDLPEDAQAKIEELGWNQERKRMGLPTTDDLAKQELLKKAWSAKGSPFSGPFDPSQVVFQ